ncbi:hypothetical protein Newbould305_2375 [Staphylococcus aureus subsp. aureus str. Newbould 305]|nr:hypothetical protein Newbould305_2375 [Staphylococcus aureus subsp. aureus str. Newbould 305]EOR49558.1 hypothetical protein M140OLGA_0208 [Staphylococcus aureus subsp. aureus 112808A]
MFKQSKVYIIKLSFPFIFSTIEVNVVKNKF